MLGLLLDAICHTSLAILEINISLIYQDKVFDIGMKTKDNTTCASSKSNIDQYTLWKFS
jgi:hypothetical protein